MTSFGNGDDNPYGRASVWPEMPQRPFRVGGPMGARTGGLEPAAVAAAPKPEAEPMVATPEAFAIPAAPTPDPVVAAAPVVAQRGGAAQPLRLTPVIVAAAVGAGGMLALVLMIGVGRPPSPVAPAATTPSALAVGALVGLRATAPVAPEPAAQPVAPLVAPATPRPTLANRATASTPSVHVAAIPTAPFSTELDLPAARPLETLTAPAEVAPRPQGPVFTPKAAPDPNAPIPTHAPDAD